MAMFVFRFITGRKVTNGHSDTSVGHFEKLQSSRRFRISLVCSVRGWKNKTKKKKTNKEETIHKCCCLCRTEACWRSIRHCPGFALSAEDQTGGWDAEILSGGVEYRDAVAQMHVSHFACTCQIARTANGHPRRSKWPAGQTSWQTRRRLSRKKARHSCCI